MPKYLFTFEKGESVRWLGHLDILRTFERAIRRAGLPVAFTNGFNPRERLAFASALSTGITGGAERASLELTDPLAPEDLIQRINLALPPGIRVLSSEMIPDVGFRDALNAFDRAEYTVVCGCAPDTVLTQVEEAVELLLASPQIEITRTKDGRSKVVNIRPSLYYLTVLPESAESLGNSRLTLDMIVAQGEGGTAKPAEVVGALAASVPGLTSRRAHRVRLLSAEEMPAAK